MAMARSMAVTVARSVAVAMPTSMTVMLLLLMRRMLVVVLQLRLLRERLGQLGVPSGVRGLQTLA